MPAVNSRSAIGCLVLSITPNAHDFVTGGREARGTCRREKEGAASGTLKVSGETIDKARGTKNRASPVADNKNRARCRQRKKPRRMRIFRGRGAELARD